MSTFEHAFDRAVQERGEAYRKARQEIIGLGACVKLPLEQRGGAKRWQVSLTAETLLGWLETPAVYEECADALRAKWAEDDVVPSMSGSVSASVRAEVAAARGPVVVPRLIEMLTKSMECNGRAEQSAAMIALSYLRDRRATMPIAEIAGEWTDHAMRLMAVSTLGVLGDQRSVPALLGLLADPSEDAELRGEVAAALGAIGDPRAFDRLGVILLDETEPTGLRVRVAHALGRLHDPGANTILLQMVETPAHTELLVAVVSALEQTGDRSALPALEKLAETHAARLVRQAAADAQSAIRERTQ